eukprot:6123147-Alexandrium_andersonii.AAC.1
MPASTAQKAVADVAGPNACLARRRAARVPAAAHRAAAPSAAAPASMALRAQTTAPRSPVAGGCV